MNQTAQQIYRGAITFEAGRIETRAQLERRKAEILARIARFSELHAEWREAAGMDKERKPNEQDV